MPDIEIAPELLSPAELFALLDEDEREAEYAKLSPSDLARLSYQWRGWWARPHQLPPEPQPEIFILQGGRGSGKTRGASELVTEWALDNPGCRIALVNATPAEVRDIMIEGVSGLCSVGPVSQRPKYEPSLRRVTWPNGSVAISYAASKPEHLHGPEHHFAWCDGLEVWKPAPSDKPELDPWKSLEMGMRLGDRPRYVVSMVPRRTRLIRSILSRKDVHIAKMSMFANRSNLPDKYVKAVVEQYSGTAMGRTFIDGLFLEEVEGALWKTVTHLDPHRVTGYPQLVRIVIGVDPPGGTVTECGIVAMGLGEDEHGYVLEDGSLAGEPDEWAEQAITLYRKYGADAIVAETNFGGEMVESTIQHVAKDIAERESKRGLHINVVQVHASRGKYVRAEPVAALAKRGKIHHVGHDFELLEEEQTTYVPGPNVRSPNRFDAMVWAASDLFDLEQQSGLVVGWAGRRHH